jgi:RHS repeat-associated protein
MTDRWGRIAEHLQYTPWGETWVEQRRGPDVLPMYQFTGKELDPETNLYYYGARYYDPQTSVWQSADKMIGQYFPNSNGSIKDLPSYGVYKSFNLAMYSYSCLNPLIYLDPDGDRPMKEGEVAMFQKVFGTRIWLNDVDIIKNPLSNNMSFVVGYTALMAGVMNKKGDIELSSDYSTENARDKAHFIHEMTHIFQNKTGRFTTIEGAITWTIVGIYALIKGIIENPLNPGEALKSAGKTINDVFYSFDLNNIKEFRDYNFERQATIIEKNQEYVENMKAGTAVTAEQRAAHQIYEKAVKEIKGEKK